MISLSYLQIFSRNILMLFFLEGGKEFPILVLHRKLKFGRGHV